MVAVSRPLEPAVPAYTPPTRALSAVQERAIRTAMLTFVEDDLAFGSLRRGRRWCVRCEGERPAPGFVEYDCGALCNPCAIDYELSRARGEVWTPAEFLAS